MFGGKKLWIFLSLFRIDISQDIFLVLIRWFLLFTNLQETKAVTTKHTANRETKQIPIPLFYSFRFTLHY